MVIPGHASEVARFRQRAPVHLWVFWESAVIQTRVLKYGPGKSGVQLLQVHKLGGAGVIFKWQNDKWEFSYFTENLE